MVKDLIYYSNMAVKCCFDIPSHKVEYYELTFVLKGTMTYYANGKRIVLKKDDGVFLKPGTIRSREKGEGYVHYVSFNFLLKPEARLLFDEHLKNVLNDDMKKLISVFHFKHITDKFHAKEKCCNILNYILCEIIDFTKIKSSNEYVMRIFNYVVEHINEKITLKTVAGFLHLSKEYTAYIFKKETGTTLSSYINEQKILISEKLILKENMTLSEIALHLNFANYDYFSKTFKRYKGISPSEYKKLKAHTD
ncbi:MAG: AraC family transcriptional regulator [Ruminococcaceae bacterium]|nr:AraC family transcriptional regulator [Oscillospiraceae bacterium]